MKRTAVDALLHLQRDDSRLLKKLRLFDEVSAKLSPATEEILTNSNKFEEFTKQTCHQILEKINTNNIPGQFKEIYEQVFDKNHDQFCKYLVYSSLSQISNNIKTPPTTSPESYQPLPAGIKAAFFPVTKTTEESSDHQAPLFEINTRFLSVGRAPTDESEGRLNIKALIPGSASQNSETLTKFISTVSKSHFCIVYDVDAKQFLLINYSKNGTYVDGNAVHEVPLTLPNECVIEILGKRLDIQHQNIGHEDAAPIHIPNSSTSSTGLTTSTTSAPMEVDTSLELTTNEELISEPPASSPVATTPNTDDVVVTVGDDDMPPAAPSLAALENNAIISFKFKILSV